MACGGTLRRTMGGVVEVRTADDADLAQLPAVEAAADELFVPLGITDLPSPAPAAARCWPRPSPPPGGRAPTGSR
jgi:hypothetical protein